MYCYCYRIFPCFFLRLMTVLKYVGFQNFILSFWVWLSLSQRLLCFFFFIFLGLYFSSSSFMVENYYIEVNVCTDFGGRQIDNTLSQALVRDDLLELH